MSIDLATAVEDFWTARARGEFFPQAYADRLTLDEAYRIQLALIDRRVAAGERQIGWKVGLTAKPIQQQFGFHEPVFACILETQPSGHVFGATELINPGFETELCVRLGRGSKGQSVSSQVRAAVDVIYPAFEIIETRGDLAKQIALALADNGQQRSVVLGAPVRLAPAMELDKVEARVQLNGDEVATGLGSAVLGNPLNSIQWLAEKLGQPRPTIARERHHHDRLVRAPVSAAGGGYCGRGVFGHRPGRGEDCRGVRRGAPGADWFTPELFPAGPT
jgi:2-keto-4-pentenoate hydratase